MTLIKFAYVGEFTSGRRRVGVGEFARRRVDRIPSYQVFETFIQPKIIANYSFLFFKCFGHRARQKKFPDLRKIIIFCKNNEQKNCPPRHTGSGQSTNVYPSDAPSLLVRLIFPIVSLFPREKTNLNKKAFSHSILFLVVK